MSTTLRNRASWTFGLPKTLHAFGVNVILLPLGIATSVLIARSVGPTGKGTLDSHSNHFCFAGHGPWPISATRNHFRSRTGQGRS